MKKLVKTILRRLLGIKFYELVMGTWHLGYIPHIRHPRSFNEKMMNRKVYRWKEIPPELADKYAVREYVAKTIGPQYLASLHGVYDSPDDIDFAKLPESFVIKATHGSDMNIIVHNRQDFDETAIRKKCRRMLADRFGLLSNESWYLGIKPRLIVEGFIQETGRDLPLDYKLFMFSGEPRFIQVNIRQPQGLTLSFYDAAWKRQEWGLKGYPQGIDIPRPKQFNAMADVARKLAGGFDFIRIDLYAPDENTILFGEMTFAPNAGIKPFTPDNSADFEIGKLWQIPGGAA